MSRWPSFRFLVLTGAALILTAAGAGAGTVQSGLVVMESPGVNNPAQSVRLRADHGLSMLNVAGNFAGASTAAIGLAADVATINKNVSARIEPRALVSAADDIVITASSGEQIRSVSASGTYGGDVGGSG